MASRIVVEVVTYDDERWPGNPERRVLTEGEYVLIEKVDGQWPTWAINSVVLSHALMHQPDRDFRWTDILDALAGGES